jgi:hypothetical protein
MSLLQQSQDPNVPAIQGVADITNQGIAGVGIFGCVGLPDNGMPGAPPLSAVGVYGSTVVFSPQSGPPGIGVYGASGTGRGVYGISERFDAIVGETQSDAHAGVTGRNKTSGANGGVGIYGQGGQFAGKFDGPVLVNTLLSPMSPTSGFAIYASCIGFDAIVGETQSDAHAGVTGRNKTSGANGGVGIYGQGGQYAGKFDGDLRVNGNAHVTGALQVDGDHHCAGTMYAKVDVVLGSDCAEDFDVSEEVEPGTVMVLTENGALQPSQSPYDKKVAGILSGAGNYRPGLILGRDSSSRERMPLALVGKVYCKVDAGYSAIEVGDLLTTSPRPGHAMKASDPALAFGSVIGKALRPLSSGRDLIPVLVALQ